MFADSASGGEGGEMLVTLFNVMGNPSIVSLLVGSGHDADADARLSFLSSR